MIDQRRVSRGYPYAEEIEVGSDVCGDTGVLGLWSPCRMYVFDLSMEFMIFKNTHHPTRLNNPTAYCLRKCSEKKGKHFGYFIMRKHHFMMLVISVGRGVRWETKAETKPLDSALSTNWQRAYLATCGHI